MQKPSLPKGTRDFGPHISAKRKYIISTIESIFKLYSFQPLETPALENLSVLTGKYGDEGDQLLFKILNSGDFLNKTSEKEFAEGSKSVLPKISEKGLRYDLTVPFARFVVMNQNEITFPFKRYQIQPVWRADRPQRGRYREFYQCDADIVGNQSDFQIGWKEVELTYLVKDVFDKLKLTDYIIYVNHREVLFGIAEYVGMKGSEIPFCVSLDKLEKVGKDAVLLEIKEQQGDADKMEAVLELIQTKHDPNDLLESLKELIKTGVRGFKELSVYFETLGNTHKIKLDFSLARGLSYYTGMIFEVKPTTVKMGSICGGGRYDNLTGVFGLAGVSGIGISFGLDRIYDVLDELNLFPAETQSFTRLLITHFSEENMKHGIGLAQMFRTQNITTELYSENAKIKKQFQYADKNNIPYVLVVGDEEMQSGNYTLKNLNTGEQSTLRIEEIQQKLQQE